MTNDITAQIVALEQELARLKAQQGVVSIAGNDLRGANLVLSGEFAGRDIIKIIVGRDGDEEERRALAGYLLALRERLRPLVLRGLAERLDDVGQRPALPEVYTTLATTALEQVAAGSFSELASFFADIEKGQLAEEYDPAKALPDRAVVRVVTIAPKGGDRIERRRLLRSRLASEAAGRQRRLILLGDPGGGKTTLLRHLAWALAERAAGGTLPLPGWDGAERRRTPRDGKARPAHLLPIIVSLRRLGQRLGGLGDLSAAVRAEALDELTRGGRSAELMNRLLGGALDTGATLLLCDGLDEVAHDGRRAVLLALREFAAAYPQVRLLITCRTRAFNDELRELVNWPVEELAPLTGGQQRHLVRALYSELAACAVIPAEQQGRLGDELIAALTGGSRLQDMARIPLLLTLMAFVLVNQGALPSDRPILYERVLDLLLGQWDKVRDGETLAQAIGQPDWDADRLAPLLNQLSYQAHKDSTLAGERGGIKRISLYEALGDFFKKAGLNAPMAAAERCLDYFEQRSGLLVPDESDSYSFVHLTLQEHCAGRYLVARQNPVAAIMEHRGDDRWREPIFLGLGLTQRQTPFTITEVIRRLLERKEGRKEKEADRWQRDLILAAELAEDRRWERLAEAGAEVEPLQDVLRDGLVALLDDGSGTLPREERIRAGYALGRLGDPRLDPRRDDYWCRIPAGFVEVDGEQVWVEEFEIAKYPITQKEVVDLFPEEKVQFLDTFFRPNLPVIVADPNKLAKEYIVLISRKVDFPIRLPSITEWSRAITGSEISTRILPVGCTSPSKYGLMSIHLSEIRLARDVPKQ